MLPPAPLSYVDWRCAVRRAQKKWPMVRLQTSTSPSEDRQDCASAGGGSDSHFQRELEYGPRGDPFALRQLRAQAGMMVVDLTHFCRVKAGASKQLCRSPMGIGTKRVEKGMGHVELSISMDNRESKYFYAYY